MDDTKITGVSYLYTFYQNVGQLTHEYVIYTNLLLMLEHKYGSDEAKYEEADKTNYLDALQSLRYWINKTYILYASLLPMTKQKDTLKPHHDNLKLWVLKREDIDKFVIAANAFLSSQIISRLLQDNEEMINDIFADKKDVPQQ